MKSKIDPNSAAQRAKAYRRSARLTQREMAKLLRTSRGVIGDIERGFIRSQRVAFAIMALMPDATELV